MTLTHIVDELATVCCAATICPSWRSRTTASRSILGAARRRKRSRWRRLPWRRLRWRLSRRRLRWRRHRTAQSAKAETSDGNVSYITSPFVGTFYKSATPDAAPFVDVGTHVKKGQVLCIVEAMKLMNEIESEINGAVLQVLVENGQPVEYGEPLFKIKQD